MSMYCIENEELRVEIASLGCELKRVYFKKMGQDVLYDGTGEWGYSDHVLFPIIGDNRAFSIDGHAHFIKGNHGFARYADFVCLEHTPTSLTLSLTHQADDSYPFDCEIRVRTYLEGNKIIRDSEVYSLSHKEMAFQYGLHPAFVCDFADATLYIEEGTILLEEEGGVIQRRFPWPHPNQWKIDRSYIEKRDTLIVTNPKGKVSFKNNQGRTITLLSPCPYFALWTPKKPRKNDFFCMESWYGLSPYKGMPLELGDRDNAQKTKDIARYHDVLIIE